MNSAMLTRQKFLQLPGYNWGDNIDGMYPTPHIFATPPLAMKAIRRLQCVGVMLRDQPYRWNALKHYHIICSQQLLYSVFVALHSLRASPHRVKIEPWDSLTVKDIPVPSELEYFERE